MLLLLFFLSSCSLTPKNIIKGTCGHTAFNETLQSTTNEQLLLNLVRLKHLDTPYFLNVNSVTTQFTASSSLTPSVSSFFMPVDPGIEISSGLSYKSQPTVSYTPLEGKKFSSLLLEPIHLTNIQKLIYSGWDIDRVMRVTLQSIGDCNNAPSASGPSLSLNPKYKKFYSATYYMRLLQENNAIHVGMDTSDSDSLSFYIENTRPNAKKLLALLPQSHTRIVNTKNAVVTLSKGFIDNDTIGILPRSVLSCMYYLSHGIDISTPHSQKQSEWEEEIRTFFHIKRSDSYQKNSFISVFYKGEWYYISNNDTESKRTFSLLLHLFNLQAGSNEETSSPILTIPLG